MSDDLDFTLDQSKKETVSHEDEFYTLFGIEDYVDDNGNTRQTQQGKKTYAKRVDGKCLVKIGIDGRAYNPLGLYSEGHANKTLAKVGKGQYNFKRVNPKVFDLYVSFLRTKNIAWLNNANRELL
jgi:hypothetical protein